MVLLMKLRSSLGNSFSTNKLTALLVTFSLFAALSTNEVMAQNKNVQDSTLNAKDQSLTAKDKYFTQLLLEIQREMRVEEGKKELQENKEMISKVLKEFEHEVLFTKEKREISLDGVIKSLISEAESLQSSSQVGPFVDKIMTFFGSLKQKVVVLKEERFATGPKEISYDLIDTYIARFTAFKALLSQKSEGKQNQNLLSSGSIALFLAQAKASIQEKEQVYNDQVAVNDSLQQDYSTLLQLVYSLESSKISLSSDLQDKETKQENTEKEFTTYEALGTNITEDDFQKKVALMQTNESLKKEITEITDSLEHIDSDLVIESNLLPVKQNDIDQNASKLTDIQKLLLDEKNKKYSAISDRFKQESKAEIDVQDNQIQKQMISLQKTIDLYNTGIDSLTIELQKINEKLSEQFTTGTSVIKQREITVQKLLKEYVRYSQELEKLYTMYKSVLSQNKEAILKLEDNNSFIKTDVVSLQSQKKELTQSVESIKVSIAAKEKEKTETKDDKRVIQIINELTVLYNNLHDTEKALTQTGQLLEQRKSFETNYIERKNQEIAQINQVIDYIDNNIMATQYAIESFVYGYHMQLKKMEIKNIQIKVDDIQKRIDNNNTSLVEQKDKENTNRLLIKKLTGSPEQKNQKEKDILVQINIIVSKMRSLKESIVKDTKVLETQKALLADLKKNYTEMAVLSKTSLKSYFEYGFKSVELQKSVVNNNYPYPNKLPINIPSFDSSIEKLFDLMKDAGVNPDITLEEVKALYK
ncbi:hypothetical protein P148_SR1C00001G0609 [candidate division SR1 bacterium RAAC1_SR1_1]|nr:hypothetical protein P148_SR1C00001G0609 [candidate division SR1 bacterium RAAC1_SR1_1]